MSSLRYQPSAVRYPAPALRWPLFFGAALWGLEAAGLLAWQLWAGSLGWLVVALAWWGWLGLGWLWWRSAGQVLQGMLQWDGGAWWWWPQGGVEPIPLHEVQVRLDLQSAMWVAWRTEEGPWQFSCLQARSDAAIWGDWRRAVYSAATVSAFQQERV